MVTRYPHVKVQIKGVRGFKGRITVTFVRRHQEIYPVRYWRRRVDPSAVSLTAT